MTTEKNEEMTSEEVLTCAINIGEQLLVSGAEYLKSALEQAGTPASTLTQKVNEANLSGITTRTYTENTTLSYRMDGNNVDLSTENAELAAEQINYNALIDSMNNEFTRMKAVLK